MIRYLDAIINFMVLVHADAWLAVSCNNEEIHCYINIGLKKLRKSWYFLVSLEKILEWTKREHHWDEIKDSITFLNVKRSENFLLQNYLQTMTQFLYYGATLNFELVNTEWRVILKHHRDAWTVNLHLRKIALRNFCNYSSAIIKATFW